MAIALITGTSTGIGLATAVALGRAGHHVYATMRNPHRAPELQTIATQEALPIVILPLDVNDDRSVQGAVAHVLAERGRIDVLVNNAGITPLGPIEERPLTEFRQTMETNFFGALRCVQAVLPHMREQRTGCIVNVTSVAGRVAQAAQGPYTASKFALEAVSEVLAQEVKAFHIRVAIVEPCIIQTPIFDKIGTIPDETRYPQERRIRALFAASLAYPVSPAVVGEQIRQIVESESWQLRYPVGPDAVAFLAWRAGMSDEAWIEFGAIQDDEAWCTRIAQDFGLDVRPYLK
jgi:NAD(P)-dependent dehydrogenase (short-subunit alcohol dehydrogenase family)